MLRSRTRLGNLLSLILLLLIVIVMILQYIPTNTVVYLPGPAEEIGPMVEGGTRNENEGRFLLTAVYQSYPNMLGYLRLLFNPHAEFHQREEVFAEGEDEAQYTSRQMVNMMGSQSNAIMAVYEELGIPYHFKDQGLYVQQVMEGYSVDGVLEAWDRLDAVDGELIKSYADLESFLNQKQEGDVITLTYTRGGVQHAADIELKKLPPVEESDGDNRSSEGSETEERTGGPTVGMGVGLLIMKTVEADDEEHRVTITTEDIGGPSAGIMFALEIYNRFVPEDISKGYTIAGTGEISPQGEVGVIGGIRHKVIGADMAGADIFLAPADYVNEEHNLTIPNYSEALATAQQIGSNMQIVEVRNLSDALEFLRQLPPKNNDAEAMVSGREGQPEAA